MKKSIQKKLRKIISISSLSVLCPVSAMAEEPAERTLDSAIKAFSRMVKHAYTQIHENPELGLLEYKTQAFLKQELEKLGYQHFIPSSKAPTAVITVLDTGRPGPVIALRADMDARPLAKGESEPETHNPRSQIPEMMHSCGHDIHSAILLGTAGVLMKNQDIISGKIIFLFQPAEEIPGGAEDIMSERILQDLGVEYMFAQHVFPKLSLGTILITPGAMLAGDNYFDITITGVQSHAASPWFGSDVPLATAHIVEGLSYLAARRFDVVKRPMIISVTEIKTGVGAYNVLPPKATIKGTIRAVEKVKKAPQGAARSIEEVIKNYLEGISKAYNVNYDWLLTEGSPPMYNDPKLFNKVTQLLGQVWSGTLTSGDRFMFAEDFAFYTQQIPSLYFALGVQKERLGSGGLHSPEFTVHPDALAYGVRLMILIAQITTQGKVVLK